jgi:hypothetical protein
MYNIYREKTQVKQQVPPEILKRKKEIEYQRQEQFRNSSSVRTNEWVASNLNSRTATNLYEGNSSLYNASTHQFREYTPNASIYIRK